MKITEAKQTYRLEERMRVIREQRESGLTVRAWCAANRVKGSNFYYWLREARKAALPTNEGKRPEGAHALVKIELPDRVKSGLERSDALAIRVQYKGVMLDIPPGTRLEDLSIVLKALDYRYD